MRSCKINRGYYMAARDTKFLFENCISWVSTANKWNTFQYEKRKFVSARDHPISVYSINSNEIMNLSTFAAKGAIRYVTVAMCSFHKTVCEIIYT